jgi:hypothetical protein
MIYTRLSQHIFSREWQYPFTEGIFRLDEIHNLNEDTILVNTLLIWTSLKIYNFFLLNHPHMTESLHISTWYVWYLILYPHGLKKNYVTYRNILYRHTQYVTYMTLSEREKQHESASL